MASNSIYTDGTYLAKHCSWHIEDSITKANWIKSVIPESLRISVKTVVELGCGRGGILNELRGFFPPDCEITGVDISEEAIEYAKNNFKGIKFICEDIYRFDMGQYDLVLCIDLLEHLYYTEDFLRMIRNASKYGVFHVPLGNNLKNKLFNRWKKQLRKFGHISFYDPASVINMFANAGIAILDYRYTFGIELPGHKWLLPFLGWMFKLSPYLTSQILGLVAFMILAESQNQSHWDTIPRLQRPRVGG